MVVDEGVDPCFLSEDDGGSGGSGLEEVSGELIGGGFARNKLQL